MPSPAVEPISSIYTVPFSYIAILRGFRYAFDPQIPTILLSDMRVSIFVNDIGVENYLNLKLPQVVTNLIPCYVIADERQIIKLTVNFLTIIEWPPATAIACYTELYGNLLLKTGGPTILEPGNEPVTVRSAT